MKVIVSMMLDTRFEARGALSATSIALPRRDKKNKNKKKCGALFVIINTKTSRDNVCEIERMMMRWRFFVETHISKFDVIVQPRVLRTG